MFASDNDITAGQSFTVRVTATDNGDYKAYCPSAPDLGEVRSGKRDAATREFGDRVHAYISGGYTVPKGGWRKAR